MTHISSSSSHSTSSALLTNTLSRRTTSLTSELLARYYLSHQEELEASREWELPVAPASPAAKKTESAVPVESKGRLGLRHLILTEAERSTYQSSSRAVSASTVKAFISATKPAAAATQFDPALGNGPPGTMALLASKTAPMDLRMGRAFPRQRDVERFEAALRDAEKTIAERKKSQVECELQQQGSSKAEPRPLKQREKSKGRPSKELRQLLEDAKSSLYCDTAEESIKSAYKKRTLTIQEDSDSEEESLVSVRLKRRISPRPSPLLVPSPSASQPNGPESPTMSLRPRGLLTAESGAVSHSTASTIRSIDLALAIPPISSSNAPSANQHMKIKQIVLGDELLGVWYHSPYPAEYVNEGNTLYICSICLKYMPDAMTYERHKVNCAFAGPPGREIYRQSSLSVFEIDGFKHKLYCQNLCLLAKMFLDHKILYYDVNAFLFYVLVSYAPVAADAARSTIRLVGYFSKERAPDVSNNVSCIVVFPSAQGQGYGHWLIDFSYLLTRTEGKLGGPETPLSDLGFLAYGKYWSEVVIHQIQSLITHSAAPISSLSVSFLELAKRTGIYPNHLLAALEWMECLLRAKDGLVAINYEKISKLRDAYAVRKRPDPRYLRY